MLKVRLHSPGAAKKVLNRRRDSYKLNITLTSPWKKAPARFLDAHTIRTPGELTTGLNPLFLAGFKRYRRAYKLLQSWLA
jgi:hypothetical protein